MLLNSNKESFVFIAKTDKTTVERIQLLFNVTES